MDVDQLFSTFGCWRPTKQNNTQFGDPYVAIIVLYYRFTGLGDPKVGARDLKVGHDPPVKKH